MAFGLATYATFSTLGVSTWLALLGGTAAGIVFNFVTLGGYAFRDLSIRRLPRFVCCYCAVYMVNLGALHALQPYVTDVILSQILLTLPIAALSYFCLSRFVFRHAKPD